MPFLEPGSVIVLASVGKTEPVTGFQERNYQAIGFKGWPPQLPQLPQVRSDTRAKAS